MNISSIVNSLFILVINQNVDDRCGEKSDKSCIDNDILISLDMYFDEFVTLLGKPQFVWESCAIWHEENLGENKVLLVYLMKKQISYSDLYVLKYYISNK